MYVFVYVDIISVYLVVTCVYFGIYNLTYDGST